MSYGFLLYGSAAKTNLEKSKGADAYSASKILQDKVPMIDQNATGDSNMDYFWAFWAGNGKRTFQAISKWNTDKIV